MTGKRNSLSFERQRSASQYGYCSRPLRRSRHCSCGWTMPTVDPYHASLGMGRHYSCSAFTSKLRGRAFLIPTTVSCLIVSKCHRWRSRRSLVNPGAWDALAETMPWTEWWRRLWTSARWTQETYRNYCYFRHFSDWTWPILTRTPFSHSNFCGKHDHHYFSNYYLDDHAGHFECEYCRSLDAISLGPPDDRPNPPGLAQQ